MNPSSRTLRLLAIAGAACSISACTEKKTETQVTDYAVPRPFIRTPDFDPGNRPVTEPMLLSPTTGSVPPRVVARQTLTAARDRAEAAPGMYDKQPGAVKSIKIAAQNARLDEVLRAILGPDGMDRSYVLDPKVANGGSTITLDIDEEMTNTDLMDLLGGLGMIYGWTIEQRNDVTYIRPGATLAQSPMTPIMEARAAFDSETPAIRVRKLRHMAATDAQVALADLISEGGKVVTIGDTLLIIDTVRQANRLSRLLSALDVPAFDGVEIWTYALGSRSPEDTRSLLDQILKPTRLGGGGTDPSVAFVPIPDSNKLMVISRDPSVQPYVRDLIAQLDRANDSDQRFRYLYRIQYYEPEGLVSLVTEFFDDRIEKSGETPPGASPPMRLVLDKEEHLLLIYATPTDYVDLLGTLRMVDRPRQQVALNSIIAEVSLRNQLEYGVEYFLEALNADGIGILDLAGGASDLLLGNATGGAVFTGGSGFAIIQALQTETDVNILSQPKITVRDGATASINVGGETPILEGDQDTQTGGLRRSITYRDIGVSLEITPAINESGDVRLIIIQEIAAVQSVGELGPEFTTRKIETEVTVPHGRTLLIGGIIETTNTTNKRKIPLLGDIPGLGMAFTSESDVEDRRELILAITPTIINSPSQVGGVMSDFLQAAHGLERSLHEHIGDLQQGVLNFEDAPDQPVLPPQQVIPTPAPASAPTDAIGAPLGVGQPQSQAEPDPPAVIYLAIAPTESTPPLVIDQPAVTTIAPTDPFRVEHFALGDAAPATTDALPDTALTITAEPITTDPFAVAPTVPAAPILGEDAAETATATLDADIWALTQPDPTVGPRVAWTPEIPAPRPDPRWGVPGLDGALAAR